MSRLIFNIIIFFVVLFSFLILSSLWGFYISVRPPKIVSSVTPDDFGFEYENINFKTKDGLVMAGWFISSVKTEAKTIILLHGYPADKGDILYSLSFLRENYNLFLFDFRYLGESEGRYSTIGAREKDDLLSAIDYLKKSKNIQEFGVWGFSLGGAVALMAAPESPEIKAVVAESSYARLDLMAPGLYRIPGFRHILGYLTGFWGKVFLGIDIQKVSPEESAKELSIPILVVHSTTDDVIPFYHALRLQNSLKDNLSAEFWFKENLIHGALGREYEEKIKDFFHRNF